MCGHANRFSNATRHQRNREVDGLTNRQHETILCEISEARKRHLNAIRPDRQLREAKGSRAVGDNGSALVRVGIRRDGRRTNDCTPGRVRDSAFERAGWCLSKCRADAPKDERRCQTGRFQHRSPHAR